MAFAASPAFLSRAWQLLAIATCLAALAGVWTAHLHRRLQQAQSRLTALEQARATEAASAPQPAPGQSASQATPNFAVGLPNEPDVPALVQDLQRACAGTGAMLLSLDHTHRDATERTLGRAEVSLVLRGDYAKLKQTVAQLLARQPTAVLRQWTLRRLGGPAELEASVQLLLLSRPLLPVAASVGAAR